MRITIRHLVAAHRVVDAIVTDDQGATHRVGHHPAENWFCTCSAGRRCRTIAAVREVVLDPAQETG